MLRKKYTVFWGFLVDIIIVLLVSLWEVKDIHSFLKVFFLSFQFFWV